MHSTFLFLASAIYFLSFVSHPFASLAGSKPRYQLLERQVNVTGPAPKICLQDDWLDALRAGGGVATAFCSSFISIPMVTLTLPPATAVVTLTATVTTQTPIFATATIPAATVTSTVFSTISFGKRDIDAAPLTTQGLFKDVYDVIYERQVCQNATIISSLSSGCSCLNISTGTETQCITVTNTRTLTELWYNGFSSAQTITQGTTTTTVTDIVYRSTPRLGSATTTSPASSPPVIPPISLNTTSSVPSNTSSTLPTIIVNSTITSDFVTSRTFTLPTPPIQNSTIPAVPSSKAPIQNDTVPVAPSTALPPVNSTSTGPSVVTITGSNFTTTVTLPITFNNTLIQTQTVTISPPFPSSNVTGPVVPSTPAPSSIPLSTGGTAPPGTGSVDTSTQGPPIYPNNTSTPPVPSNTTVPIPLNDTTTAEPSLTLNTTITQGFTTTRSIRPPPGLTFSTGSRRWRTTTDAQGLTTSFPFYDGLVTLEWTEVVTINSIYTSATDFVFTTAKTSISTLPTIFPESSFDPLYSILPPTESTSITIPLSTGVPGAAAPSGSPVVSPITTEAPLPTTATARVPMAPKARRFI